MSDRKSLQNVGGDVEVSGDLLASNALGRALAATDTVSDDELTHGFHAYPARMHPGIARSLLADLADRHTRLLDPFCGGGTVLVEGRRAHATVFGIDLNPIAVRLARVRAAPLTPRQRVRLEATLARVADAVRERADDGRRAEAPLTREERNFYEPHVLAELAGLRAEITAGGAKWEQDILKMVLSAMIVKVSRQESDTSQRLVDKTIRKGFCTEFFVKKTQEFMARSAALAKVIHPKNPEAVVYEGDARNAPTLLGKVKIDLVLTSPPYAGTYDYVDHHARRYLWLGIDPTEFAAHEMGARRRMAEAKPAAWDEQIRQSLVAMRQVLDDDGSVILLMGDGEVAGTRMPADEQLRRVAGSARLTVRATASQVRADWHGGEPRREHLIWLEPV